MLPFVALAAVSQGLGAQINAYMKAAMIAARSDTHPRRPIDR